jgi:hypothetical protein
MIIMIIMKQISCADLVWVATALLTRDEPERTGFSHDEIRQKVYAIEPDHGFTDSAVRTHISSHCVANKKPDPGKHCKLYLNPDGTYRLYRPRDQPHADRRNGKALPKAQNLPAKYQPLLAWYDAAFKQQKRSKIDDDPILALEGVGKEMWASLGGGEKFIRELRENWYGPVPQPTVSEKLPKHKKAV